jgi:regulator of protease activity HflC (stomatin/prohibitin superfamily)
MQGLIIIAVIGLIIVMKSFYIFQEYERGVVFTLGRLSGNRGPGIVLVLPFIQRVVRIDQRTITMDIPTQDVITRDNVSVKVNAVLYYQVIDPSKAIVQVENYHYATSQIAQTTLRSVCGQKELDQLLQNREEINLHIQDIIDNQTDPWGIKVSVVEVKHIDLPQDMQRAMAKQAEAERERRAKVIQAEGEYEASAKLTEAAKIMSEEPQTLQLRYLETLRDIASEQNSTIIFPFPIEMFSAFLGKK